MLDSAVGKEVGYLLTGETGEKITFENNRVFCFHSVNFKISIRYWRDDQVVSGYTSSQFQGEGKTEYREWNHTCGAFFFFMQLRLNEITKEITVWTEQEVDAGQSLDSCQDLEVEYN